MIKITKFLFALASVAVIVGAWVMYTTISPRLHTEQKQLVADSNQYLERKIFDVGIDLLNRALQIETDDTPNLWRKLADSYYEWGYVAQDFSRYRDTLRTMISGGLLPDGESLDDLYIELYNNEKEDRSAKDTLAMLRDGIRKTDSEKLRKIYGQDRYQTIPSRHTFDEAYALINGAGLVRIGDVWGYVGTSGNLTIRPVFELATNFAVSGRDAYAAVYKETDYKKRDSEEEVSVKEVYLINRNGVRRALADDYVNFEVDEIARFNGTYFSARLPGQNDFAIFEWTNTYARPAAVPRENRYEFYGLTADGLTAAKQNGKWNLRGGGGISERAFEEIAIDESGRCTAEGAGVVFV